MTYIIDLIRKKRAFKYGSLPELFYHNLVHLDPLFQALTNDRYDFQCITAVTTINNIIMMRKAKKPSSPLELF